MIERGANTELVNNAGFNAFQAVLEQALDKNRYNSKKLAAAYRLLEPDSMDIQVEGRLIKLDNRLMEFLMLNLMMAMFYTRLGDKIVHTGGAFQSADFVKALMPFPDYLLPARRKKQTYISSILSKNEISREGPYNRKLFLRVKHGHYIINPGLSIRIEGEWRNIYDVLSFDMVAHHPVNQDKYYARFDLDSIFQKEIEKFAAAMKEMAAGAESN